jgi:TRAP transporter TAXI family solute receptor
MGEWVSRAVLDCRAMNAKRLACVVAVIGWGMMACGPSGERGAGPRSREFLSLGTAPPGGAFFVVGGALSEVLQANPGSIPWQVTAEATKGTQENIRRLVAGDLDLALANAAITYFAVRGEGKWEAPQDVQVVMTLAPNVAMFLTPAKSEVERLGDLAGRRVVVGPAGAGFEYFVGPILEAHGVQYEDFTPLYNTQAGAVDMLADGSAEAAFLGGAIPTASITQATSSQDIRFVPFDEMATQEEPFFGMNVGSMQLLTSAAADEELIYEITRVLWENRASVVEKHAAGRAIQPEVVVRDTGVDFHPGAVRYYREIGIWPQGSGD